MAPKTPRLEDLPRKWARFCLGVGAFARQELVHDFTKRRCVIACSGGSDSTALLLIATLLCRKYGGVTIAAHLNHGLRPEAEDDAAFVAELCSDLGVELVQTSVDVGRIAAEDKIGVEEAGRRARYTFFDQVRRELAADAVLVAHHLNDLAEDQLMRLTRGTGWPSLGGMAGYDPLRLLLRPLLLTPKCHLEEFLIMLNQLWRTDVTNFERNGTRNRIRLDILPGLLAENPAYLDSAARLWRQARIDEAHWDSELARLVGKFGQPDGQGQITVLWEELMPSPAPLRLRLYRQLLESLGPGQPLCDSLFKLDDLVVARAVGKTVGFPGDKTARIIKPGLVLQVIDRKKECG